MCIYFIFLLLIIFSFGLLSGTVESWQVKAFASQSEPQGGLPKLPPELQGVPGQIGAQEQPSQQQQQQEQPSQQQQQQEQPSQQQQQEQPVQSMRNSQGQQQEQPGQTGGQMQQQPGQQPNTPSGQEQPGSQSPGGGSNAPSSGGGCLIATAAFGSELSPQVQFLRNFRDDYILSTVSGSSFMNVFNAWYYSFSPHVANYERANPWFQQIVKVSIYPLLGILQLSEKAYWYMDDEYSSLTAGLVASSLIGSIYLSPFLLLSRRIRKTEFDKKLVVIAVASVFLAVFAVFASMSYTNELALMITTSILVLLTIAVSSIFAARGIVYVGKLIQKTKSEFLTIH